MNTKSGSGRLLALVLCALVSGCDKAAPTAIDVVPRVKTVEVGELARGQARRLSGKLVAALSSPLSFGVSGTVAQVQVESGQAVLAGTLLAQLDPEPLRVALEQARAKLAIARANSAEARQSFERITVLLKQNASSQMELDRATADYSTARGNLRTAQGDLEQRERDLGRTDLVAPYDGAIASRSVEPFQEIGGNTEAFLLDSSDAMEVEVRVPETIIRYISYGQTVAVTFPTFADLSLPGEVAKIGSRAESGNAFPVSVRLTNGAVDLRPGMTASVTFHIDSHAGDAPVYTIPLAAIAIDAGAAGEGVRAGAAESDVAPVFVVGEDGALEIRQIRLGDIRGNQLEVYEGLAPGEHVVVAGLPFLREGLKVELWRPERDVTDG